MIIHYLLIILANMIWGVSFIAMKWMLQSYSGLAAHSLRFILAGLISIVLITIGKRWKQSRKDLSMFALAGFFLFLTLWFQTVGLKYTSVAKSGFITTLYAIFTPMISAIYYRRKFHPIYLAMVIVSLIGMVFLSGAELSGFNFGDFLSLMNAIFASFHIFYLGIVAKRIRNPLEFNFFQNAFIGGYCLIALIVLEPRINLAPVLAIESFGGANPLTGLFILSVLSSLLAFSLQVYSQKKVPAHVASLLFMLESPFAALFAYFLLGEVMTGMQVIGAWLITFSVVLGVWGESRELK